MTFQPEPGYSWPLPELPEAAVHEVGVVRDGAYPTSFLREPCTACGLACAWYAHAHPLELMQRHTITMVDSSFLTSLLANIKVSEDQP